MSNKAPECLYHYTTVEAFTKIVTTQELWATDILYLNDREEFYRGLKCLRTCLHRKAKETADADARKRYEWLRRDLGRIGPGHSIPLYVCSFSRSGDDLSQWRAYSPNGGGVAIAFRLGRLRSWANSQKLSLYPCLYDHREQTQGIRRIADKICDAPLEPVVREQVTPAQVESIRANVQFHRLLLNLTCGPAAFKNKAFSAKKEWRLVKGPNNVVEQREEIGFRCRRGMIVPYCKLKLTDDIWQDAVVWVGPCAYAKDAKASIERLLLYARANSLPASVKTTTIPYRYW